MGGGDMELVDENLPPLDDLSQIKVTGGFSRRYPLSLTDDPKFSSEDIPSLMVLDEKKRRW